jgi:hypothetical protein
VPIGQDEWNGYVHPLPPHCATRLHARFGLVPYSQLKPTRGHVEPGLGSLGGQTSPPPASGAPLLEPLAPDPLEAPLVDPLVEPLEVPLAAPLEEPLAAPLDVPLVDPLFAVPLEAPLPLPLEAPLPLAPPSVANEKASPPHPTSGRAPKTATIRKVRSKVISMYPWGLNPNGGNS